MDEKNLTKHKKTQTFFTNIAFSPLKLFHSLHSTPDESTDFFALFYTFKFNLMIYDYCLKANMNLSFQKEKKKLQKNE